MKPPTSVARFFTEAAVARSLLDISRRWGWWKPRPQSETDVTKIIDDYETESREQ